MVDKIEIKDTTDQLGKFLDAYTTEIIVNGVVVARGYGKNEKEAEVKAKRSFDRNHLK